MQGGSAATPPEWSGLYNGISPSYSLDKTELDLFSFE